MKETNRIIKGLCNQYPKRNIEPTDGPHIASTPLKFSTLIK